MQTQSMAALAAIACMAALAGQASPANACARSYECARQRAPVRQPRYYRDESYRGSVRLYRANPCAYGDCACIRSYAVATGAQVWWDRYQACTGG